ncbi:hypothetical 9kD protein, partial [Human betaherpesvirus 5]
MNNNILTYSHLR